MLKTTWPLLCFLFFCLVWGFFFLRHCCFEMQNTDFLVGQKMQMFESSSLSDCVESEDDSWAAYILM